jgi:hypothetical protein
MQGMVQTLLNKMDLFMNDFVIPVVNPSRVVWLFSLSGGIDSMSMRELVKLWYQQEGRAFREFPFHLNQWNGPASLAFEHSEVGVPVTTLDAVSYTATKVNYKLGQQAPCGACSSVRHELSDRVLTLARDKYGMAFEYIVARGHHLTDLAVSLLWRYLVGRQPAQDMLQAQKGSPLQQLTHRGFIGKPLIYFLKGEIQEFAIESGIRSFCCGCPACLFPGRRDIVTDTAVRVLRNIDPMWEFSAPGISEIITSWSHNGSRLESVRSISHAPAYQSVSRLLPNAAEHVQEFYEENLDKTRLQAAAHLFTTDLRLDDLGFQALAGQGHSAEFSDSLPIPNFFLALSRGEDFMPSLANSLMWLCRGPFWAAFVLPHTARERVLSLQDNLFPRLNFDERWSHVTPFLHWYYASGNFGIPYAQTSDVRQTCKWTGCSCQLLREGWKT